jgi:hypothetical protein
MIEKFRKEQWDYYFGGDVIPHERVSKVLISMKKPEGYADYTQIPLCCFWFYISKEKGIPFSRHSYTDGKSVHVFSASAYLRTLNDVFVDISMPRFERRLNLIDELIKEPN